MVRDPVSMWDAHVRLMVTHLFPHHDVTVADAWLETESGLYLHAHGIARRNPADVDVPEIGKEIAVARALQDLAGRLAATAWVQIETGQGGRSERCGGGSIPVMRPGPERGPELAEKQELAADRETRAPL